MARTNIKLCFFFSFSKMQLFQQWVYFKILYRLQSVWQLNLWKLIFKTTDLLANWSFEFICPEDQCPKVQMFRRSDIWSSVIWRSKVPSLEWWWCPHVDKLFSYFPVPVCWLCNTFYPCLLYPWHMHASLSGYGAAKHRELLKQTGTITFFSTRKRWVVLFWKEMDPWVSTKRTCFWFSYTVTKTNRWKNRKKEETKIFGEEEKCFCFSSFLSPLHLSKSQ